MAVLIRHCPTPGDAIHVVIYGAAQCATCTSVCGSSESNWAHTTLCFPSADYILTGIGVIGRGITASCGAGRYSIAPVCLPRQSYSSLLWVEVLGNVGDQESSPHLCAIVAMRGGWGRRRMGLGRC